MMKRDLDVLKDLPTPKPATGAKDAALSAAMAAFDAANEKAENSTQENGDDRRPTLVTSNRPRRRIMRSMTSRYAIAASVAAMAVSLPVLLQYVPFTRTNQPAPIVVSEAAKKFAELVREKEYAERRRAVEELQLEMESRRVVALERSRTEADRRARQVPTVSIGRDGRLVKDTEIAAVAPAKRRRPASNQISFDGGRKIASNGYVGSGQLSAGTGMICCPGEPTPGRPAFQGRDRFEKVASNPVKQVAEHPVSTFSVDVDTASYAVVRRWLNQGKLPPRDAVRVEELINYFDYGYAGPESASEPFRTNVKVMPSPWNSETQLVHIGIKGYELADAERPRANLVLLIDVSGSMRGQGRLPLLKNAFKMLLDNLRPDDTVGIVTYASGSGVALEPTKVSEKHKIISAINQLGAGGSTAGAQGIQDAYRLAQAGFDKGAVNRVILGTDGDFNVGITDRQELKGFIERKRKSGIFLSILGFGQGNYNDALMQTLAQNGNGTAAYIDTLNEARKVLVEEASSTLFPIAKDVKIQFEFNPDVVRDYRLIGYETRALKREDFNNDKIDAGDVGSGHAVTAIYEVTPVGAKTRVVDGLRYGTARNVDVRGRAAVTPDNSAGDDAGNKAGELGFFKLRYKLPAESMSRLIKLPVKTADKLASVDQSGEAARFAVAVAAFGQLLRGEPWLQDYNYDDVIKLANGARGDDPFGLRAEFVNLVRLAKSAAPE